jgi:enterochelin esterase-like enzyme
MTEQLFPSERWHPRPRPRGIPAPVPVRRVDAGYPAPRPDEETARGPEILWADDRRAHVRFQHHAPTARAVALSASGWWRASPAGACDLHPADAGWFTGVFEVPVDWAASYGFVEHRGPGDPPWWENGFRDPDLVPVLDAGNPRRQGAGRGGPRSVVRARSDEFSAACDHPAPAVLSTLPGAPDEPEVLWWAPDGRIGTPSPLVVFFDGQAHTGHLGTAGALSRLVDSGVLPPLRAVFVPVGADVRHEELGVPEGQARWVAETLIPRLQPVGVAAGADARHTVVTGSSFGGLSALFALARRPDRIGTAIAQSVSLWRYGPDALLAPLQDAGRRAPLTIRLQTGSHEGGQAAEALAARLAENGVDARFRLTVGGHDWAWWQVEALRELAEIL